MFKLAIMKTSLKAHSFNPKLRQETFPPGNADVIFSLNRMIRYSPDFLQRKPQSFLWVELPLIYNPLYAIKQSLVVTKVGVLVLVIFYSLGFTKGHFHIPGPDSGIWVRVFTKAHT